MDLRVDVRGGGEVRHYLAHKLVLCALSGFFRKTLWSNGNWTRLSRLEVDADPDVFEVLLSLVYDGRAAVEARRADETEEALKVPPDGAA